MLRDSVVVVRTRPRAIPLAMITMRKSTHGFSFVSHIWDACGAPLGGPSGTRSSAIMASGFVCGSVRTTTTTATPSRNMAAILQVIKLLPVNRDMHPRFVAEERHLFLAGFLKKENSNDSGG